jgi:hypothetical protein
MAAIPAFLPPLVRHQFGLSIGATRSEADCRKAFAWAIYHDLGWAIPRQVSDDELTRATKKFLVKGNILKIPTKIFKDPLVMNMADRLKIPIQSM